MQRSLAYALSPAPGVPLRFLLTAPWFALLAALLMLWAGPDAFASRWSSPMLGATHLLTLGYLSMAMAGSMLQLIPVVTGTELALVRVVALTAWGALVIGTLLLAAALGFHVTHLFAPAALVLPAAFLLLAAPLLRALAAPAPPGAMPMVRGMRLALVALALTVALGVALATQFAGLAVVPLLLLADLHAAWGLIGWVAMLVLCVAFQVIPMFQSSQTYPAPVARWAPWLLASALMAWSGALIGAPQHARLAGIPVAAILAAFAILSAWLLSRRKRKEADTTTLYWRLSLTSLALAGLLYMADDGMGLITGVVFVCGFAMGAVNGMLYKIVPFLLWYHLQQHPHARKGAVPPIRTILPDAGARHQFWLHACALVLLAGAVYWPAWLARPAAALLALASVHLALDLARAAHRCHRLQQQFQPS